LLHPLRKKRLKRLSISENSGVSSTCIDRRDARVNSPPYTNYTCTIAPVCARDRTRILARPQIIEEVCWTFRIFRQSFLDNIVFDRTEWCFSSKAPPHFSGKALRDDDHPLRRRSPTPIFITPESITWLCRTLQRTVDSSALHRHTQVH